MNEDISQINETEQLEKTEPESTNIEEPEIEKISGETKKQNIFESDFESKESEKEIKPENEEIKHIESSDLDKTLEDLKVPQGLVFLSN